MKGWLPAAAAGVLVCTGIMLFAPVRKPGDFTGQWYSCSGKARYYFEDGMISCEEEDGSGRIAGAYIFGKEKVLLYVTGVDGLETEKELHLVRRPGGDLLCDSKSGMGRIYFSRDPDSGMSQ